MLQLIVEITDVNDNKPIFNTPNYIAYVMEGERGNDVMLQHDDVILQVEAKDADSNKYNRVKYRY